MDFGSIIYRPDAGTRGKTSASMMRKEWDSNPEPIKSPARYQRLATAVTVMCGPWRNAAEMGAAQLLHPKGYYTFL